MSALPGTVACEDESDRYGVIYKYRLMKMPKVGPCYICHKPKSPYVLECHECNFEYCFCAKHRDQRIHFGSPLGCLYCQRLIADKTKELLALIPNPEELTPDLKKTFDRHMNRKI